MSSSWIDRYISKSMAGGTFRAGARNGIFNQRGIIIMKKISLDKEKQETIIRRNNFFSGNYFHFADPRTQREASFFKLVRTWNAQSIIRERF
jgi:hypothetical protein